MGYAVGNNRRPNGLATEINYVEGNAIVVLALREGRTASKVGWRFRSFEQRLSSKMPVSIFHPCPPVASSLG